MSPRAQGCADDVLERPRGAGARTIAITNDAGSPLAGAGDAVVELGAGEELAVPATKTFLAQLAAFALVAQALGPVSSTARGLDPDAPPGLSKVTATRCPTSSWRAHAC